MTLQTASAPTAASGPATLAGIAIRRPAGRREPPQKKPSDLTERLAELQLDPAPPPGAAEPRPVRPAPEAPARSGEPDSAGAIPPEPAAPAAPSGPGEHGRLGAIARRAQETARRQLGREPAANGLAAAPKNGAALHRPEGAPRSFPEPSPDVFTRWMQLRNGRRLPAWSDFDAAEIGRRWPECLLLTCRPQTQRPGEDGWFERAERLSPAPLIGPDAFGSPMVVEWVLSVGRDAARQAAPLEDVEGFLLPNGTVSYRILALPLSSGRGEVDHVLCQLTPA